MRIVFLLNILTIAIVLSPVSAYSSNILPTALRGTISEDGEKKSDEEADEDDENDAASNRFTYTPYAAVSIGRDTNPDEVSSAAGESTGFQRYDAGMDIEYSNNGVVLELKTLAQFRDLFENSDSNRWKYEIEIDGAIDLSKASRFEFGFARDHDKLGDSETLNNESYAGIKREGRTVHMGIRGTIEHDVDLTSDDDTGSEPPEAFDYIKTSLSTQLLLNADGRVSPFFRATVSGLNYPDQDIDAVNRNASDFAFVGGIALRPGKKFRFDIGGRYNIRDSEDIRISRHSNTFIDLSLMWKPNDKFQLLGAVTRELDEPGADGSVVADLTTYSLESEWRITGKFGLELSGELSRTDEIGGDEISYELELEGRAFYAIRDELRLFAALSQLWAHDTFPVDPDDKYKRTVVRAGIETDF